MSNRYRNQKISSTDSNSDHSAWNKGFQNSSNAAFSTFDSNSDSACFKSLEVVYPTNTDESDLRRLIENDTFLNNDSKIDSFQTNYKRTPSIIIAAGTSKGSTKNTSIQSINSSILGGAMDSDESFYSPNATIKTISYTTENILNERLPSDDQFTDCENSSLVSTPLTDSTLSTKYKSLRDIFSPMTHSENNNTIFKSCHKSLNTQVFSDADSQVPPEESSKSNKCFEFPRQVHHLTTILEESNTVSNNYSKRISGVQLLSVVEDLQKDPMSMLPANKNFNDTVKRFAEILNKSSKDITIDQLAHMLLYTLQNNYNYSDGMSSIESFQSSEEVLNTPRNSYDNSGMELDSIVKELRLFYPQDKKIECESSPDWPLSVKSFTLNTTRKAVFVSRTNEEPNSFNRKKEYFPMFPSSTGCTKNKENLNVTKSSQQKVNVTLTKRKVRFASKNNSSSNISRNFSKTQKKKYVTTPPLKRDKCISEKKDYNTTTASEDSFQFWEKLCNRQQENGRSKLRRSISLTDIVTEESTTAELSKINHRKDNQRVLRNSRYDNLRAQERIKKYTKRRSMSAERCNYLPVQVNNEIPRKEINMPSTSGMTKNKPSNQQKNRNPSPKIIITSENGSISEALSQEKTQYKTANKYFLQKASPKYPSRKSSGVDTSHIPAVSQLRRMFSPAAKATVPSVQLKIPRVQITKSSPKKSINNSPTPILSLRLKKLSKSQEKLSQRKPWKP